MSKISLGLIIVLVSNIYIWNAGYEAGENYQLAEAGKILKEEQRKSAERLELVISERNLSRKKVIELNEIIKNPAPTSPTIVEIIKYKPAYKCIFDDEFKRLLNQSWEDGFKPSPSSD